MIPFRGNPNGVLPLSVQQGGRDFPEGESEDMSRKRKFGQGSVTQKSRIKKDGTTYRYWEGRYYDENGKQRTVTGKTRAKCEERLDARLKERGAPKERKSTTNEWKKRTVGEWLLFWFERYKSAKQGEDGEFLPGRKATTANATKGYIEKRILPVLGEIRIEKLTALTAEDFVYSIEKSNTRKKVYDILHGAFRKLVLLGCLNHNVFDAIDKPTHRNAPRRPYSIEEQNVVLENFSEEYAQLFFFLCATGLRLGEFLALRAEDVDFEEHVIKIQRSENRLKQTTLPKTEKSVRKVFFTDELFRRFPLEKLGTYTRDGILQYFDDHLRALDIRGVLIHATRHTFASLCYAAKMPDKITQAMLGHSSLKMTMDVYTDLLKKGNSPIFEYIRELRSTLISTLILF